MNKRAIGAALKNAIVSGGCYEPEPQLPRRVWGWIAIAFVAISVWVWFGWPNPGKVAIDAMNAMIANAPPCRYTLLSVMRTAPCKEVSPPAD
jgi:hypothetical protein